MPQFRPLLAYNAVDRKSGPIHFPVLVSPKIDGIRCLITQDGAVSRTLKPIPNIFIRHYLSQAPIGLDGELTVGDSFNSSTSAIMSHFGEPDFTYHIFDHFGSSRESFVSRFLMAAVELKLIPHLTKIQLLGHKSIQNQEELEMAEAEAIAGGFEGLMIRRPSGHYKFGRSTANERLLGKIKRFEDREATVLGITPLYENQNQAEIDNLGLQKRSHSQENKTEKELMGSLTCRDKKFASTFEIGTGFTAAQRREFYLNPPLGRTVKYKYLPHGTIDLPRHPVFLGFRSKDDL
jgi:DNA ligase-1